MKHSITVLITLLVILSGTSSQAALSGAGTSGNPYLIQNLADLLEFAEFSNYQTYWSQGVHTKLMADINLSGQTRTNCWIGDTQGYHGSFDGNGHTISNIAFNSGSVSMDRGGFFSFLGTTATVTGLALENVTITAAAASRTGGFVGLNGGTIRNCSVTGTFAINSAGAVGGFVGENQNTIIGCHTVIDILLGRNAIQVGGFVGYHKGEPHTPLIMDSYVRGNIEGGTFCESIGGFVGYSYWGDIYTSYSTYDTEGSDSIKMGDDASYIGGFVGQSYGSLITDCYVRHWMFSGYGAYGFGGMVGYSESSSIKRFYVKMYMQIKAASEYYGPVYGYGAGSVSHYFDLEESSKPQSSFEAIGFNFDKIWEIPYYDNYPKLQMRGFNPNTLEDDSPVTLAPILHLLLN